MSDHDGSTGGTRRPFDGAAGPSRPRHRRRREPGDPTTTGSIPIVRGGDSLPDPTIEYRTPERPTGDSPYFEVRYRHADVEPVSFTEPVRPPESAGLFDILDATRDDSPAAPPSSTRTQPPASHSQRPASQAPPAPRPQAPQHETGQYETGQYTTPQYEAPQPAMERSPRPQGPDPLAARAAAPTVSTLFEEDEEDGDDGVLSGRSMPARRRNRKVVIGVLIAALVVLLVVAGLGLKAFGVFESSTDYTSTTGHGAALVEVPSDASLREIGDALASAGVVGSRKAFVTATGAGTISAGFYRLPKEISAAAAVGMMEGNEHRVGRVIIPDGRQLDSKKGADGAVTPGILEMISQATSMKTDDGSYGVSVKELVEAAGTAGADALGIPSWARETFDKLTPDHRRIEGLIASGTWEHIDPRADATQILHDLISDSAKRFTAWGLEGENATGLTPYQTLVTASIVEREARMPDDFSKVSRVILNRLAADQRLEMDSTANYTANIQDIDLAGDAYVDTNAWNTYQHKGLSITPIGAVGERALNATLHPADGDWLYFVTVDKEGRTLFSKTFAQHKKNRQVACKNKLLVTGCE